jgi:hypothetical protein
VTLYLGTHATDIAQLCTHRQRATSSTIWYALISTKFSILQLYLGRSTAVHGSAHCAAVSYGVLHSTAVRW